MRTRISNLLLVAAFVCLTVAQELDESVDELIDELIDLDDNELPLQSDFVMDEATLVIDDLIEEELNSPTVTSGNSQEEVEAMTEPEKPEKPEKSEKPEIEVKSNLESMSDEELVEICTQRGFGIEGDSLTHAEYVTAAEQCLSLENEMNAILAENPELAAELEEEIERMRIEKERLEQEREAMLAEKRELEEKLRQSGVDPPTLSQSSSAAIANAKSPQSVEETLRETFTILFDRVGADLRLVGKVARVMLKPLETGVELVWRYIGPSVEGLLKKGIRATSGVLEVKRLRAVLAVVGKQLNAVRSLLGPILAKLRLKVVSLLVLANEQEKVRKVTGIVGAVFGPLVSALGNGWQNIKPGVVEARTKTASWFNRLKDDEFKS